MIWRKASLCQGGECVEVGWRTASMSGGGNCVETAICTCDKVRVRDSKDPDGPVLEFGREVWREFTGAIKAGQLRG